jgi:DNA-directed RNA polymerase specialized sigma24 family protein
LFYFRHEYGRLVALLVGRVGLHHLEAVEDAVQCALLAALTAWVANGIPDNSGAWLYRVAHNNLLSVLRKDQRHQHILDGSADQGADNGAEPVSLAFAGEVRDELLRMLFVCCDEKIPQESRLVLALERLESRAKRDADALSELAASAAALEEEANERARDTQRAESALATRRRRFDEAIAEGKISGKAFTRIALEHQSALVHVEASTKAANKARAALDKNLAQRATIEDRTEDIATRKKRLEPQRTIRQLDVTQDTILTAAKLTAAQLISFVMREYLPSMPMTPQTFVQRVLCVHVRKEIKVFPAS